MLNAVTVPSWGFSFVHINGKNGEISVMDLTIALPSLSGVFVLFIGYRYRWRLWRVFFHRLGDWLVTVPLGGVLCSSEKCYRIENIKDICVTVPFFGFSFFHNANPIYAKRNRRNKVTVPSWGFLLFIILWNVCNIRQWPRVTVPSWGFSFVHEIDKKESTIHKGEVKLPSPCEVFILFIRSPRSWY